MQESSNNSQFWLNGIESDECSYYFENLEQTKCTEEFCPMIPCYCHDYLEDFK